MTSGSWQCITAFLNQWIFHCAPIVQVYVFSESVHWFVIAMLFLLFFASLFGNAGKLARKRLIRRWTSFWITCSGQWTGFDPCSISPSKSCMIVCKMIATWFSNDSATAALVQLDDTKSLHTNDTRHPHHAATIYRNKLKSEMEVSSWQRNCAWKLYQSYSILIQFRFTYWVLRMIYHCYEIQLIIRVSRTRWWYLVARLAPDQQWPLPLLLVLQANVLWLLAFETCGKMWDVDFEEANVW